MHSRIYENFIQQYDFPDLDLHMSGEIYHRLDKLFKQGELSAGAILLEESPALFNELNPNASPAQIEQLLQQYAVLCEPPDYSSLVRFYANFDRLDEAYSFYLRGLFQDSDSGNYEALEGVLLRRVAFAHLQNGKNTEAIRILQRLSQIESNSGTLRDLADAYLASNQIDLALEAYSQALRHAPGSCSILLNQTIAQWIQNEGSIDIPGLCQRLMEMRLTPIEQNISSLLIYYFSRGDVQLYDHEIQVSESLKNHPSYKLYEWHIGRLNIADLTAYLKLPSQQSAHYKRDYLALMYLLTLSKLSIKGTRVEFLKEYIRSAHAFAYCPFYALLRYELE